MFTMALLDSLWLQHLAAAEPRQGQRGVYITQILPFADKKSLPLYYEFERAFYG